MTSEPTLRQLLLVDDEADFWAGPLDQGLRPLGFELSTVTSPDKVLVAIRSRRPEVVLLDLHFPGDDLRRDDRTTGGQLLGKIRQEFKHLPVVIFTTRLADGDIALEPFAVQPHGLFDKSQIASSQKKGEPWPPKLAWTLTQAIEIAASERRSDDADLGFVVGKTEAMRRVAAAVRSAARHRLAVLIHGEIGTGKKTVAATIHHLSGRQGRFGELNCSGLNPDELQAKLFGTTGRAGTRDTSPGLFELVHGGTLLMEKIQAMPEHLQRELQRRIDGPPTADTEDARLLVVTSHPLSDLVADGLLLESLAYSLSRCRIEIPPLRDRLEDFDALCTQMIDSSNKAVGRFVLPTLRPEVLSKLRAHTWPGNLRELRTVLERAIIATRSNVLSLDDIEMVPIAASKPISPIVRGAAVNPGHDEALSLSQMAIDQATHAENLPIEHRYDFIKGLDAKEMRRLVLIELVGRLRKSQRRRVKHKDLAYFLDPIKDIKTDFDRIRAMVIAAGVALTNLECNQ